MPQSSSRFTTEHMLFALAAALALTVRLWGLGRAPLGENEAMLALQALDVAARHPAALGSAPLLTALTGLGFFLFGSTETIARLVPALLGSLLPLLAWPLRKPLGRRAALLFAFALALDPGLVALSRIADSPIPAALALSAAVLAAARARWDWALPLAALGVLLGPAFWQGGLVLLLALALLRILGYSIALPIQTQSLRRGALYALGVAVFGSTLAFWVPQGLGALFNSLTAFGKALFTPTGSTAREIFALLAAYAPLAVIAGITGATIAVLRQRPALIFAALLAASALVLSLLSPGREPGQLVWVLLPLWALAAWALTHAPRLRQETRWQAAIILALLVFFWLTLISWSRTAPDTRAYRLSLLLSILGFLLVPLLGSMMAFSWKEHRQTWGEAFGGLIWGTIIATALFSLSALAHAAYAPRAGELWYLAPAAPQQRLLETTLADLGQQRHGLENTLETLSVSPQWADASLRWMLRNNPNARFETVLPPDAAPEAIITAQQQPIAQTAGYRGQSFPMSLVPPLADPVTPQGFIQWLAFRTPRPAQNQVVLWVRNDLFPDNETK